MKYKLILTMTLVTALLTGCGGNSTTSDNSLASDTSQDLTSETSGSEEVSHSYVPPVSSTEEVTLDLFALNDLHGSIFYNAEDSPIEYGMYKIASYLREKEAQNPGGTINMDAGDIWQGSADSNITNGKVLVEMFNSLNWAASALGNHEFDWYDENITENRELANYPFLGANIMHKDTGKLADNIVDGPSTMIERNGIKIGIIGTIGSDLESSILASAVADYSFEPVTNYIIEQSNQLRLNGANLIVLLTHDSLTSYRTSGEYGPVLEPSGGKTPYVDVVFTGHAHTYDRQMINGVPILQTNGNSKQLMHVNLTVAPSGIKVNTYTHIDSELASYPNDPLITEVYGKYSEQISVVKDEVVGSLTSLMSKSQILRLANRAMYERAKDDFDIDVAVHNSGGIRVDNILAGEVTFGQIYKAVPFDNSVVIVKSVPGNQVRTAISGNGTYFRPGLSASTLNDNEMYNIVTINYVSESSRNTLKNFEQEVIENVFVRDLIADYFRSNGEVDPYSI